MKKNELRHVLLIRTDRIGDVILTTPVASILHNYYPEVKITFLASPYTAPLLCFHQYIDDIVTYHALDRHRGLKGHLLLAQELKEKNIDAAICFSPSFEIVLALFAAGIPLRIGTGYRWYSLFLNSRIFEHRKYGLKHELEYNLSLLKPFVTELTDELSKNISFDFQLPQDIIFWGESIIDEMNITKDYIIIHPGSGGSAPNLSIRQYQSIIDYLIEYTTFDILLTGSISEKPLIREISDRFKSSKIRDTAGLFGLEQLMVLIRNARLLISSSTGPLHIANALKTPVAAFYSPAITCSPVRWGPYHQQEWVLVPDIKPCKTCDKQGCVYGNCLETISEKRIVSFIKQRLESIL